MRQTQATPLLDQRALQPFIDCCVGRHDDYAIQTADGLYPRVGAPLTYDLIRQHLQGFITIGTHVINERGYCRFVVYDSDDPSDGLSQLLQVQSHLAGVGVSTHLELSRRGAHLWAFLPHPVLPALARQWLQPYCPAGIEFYPKQDTANCVHPGSLIRLPLGVHRLSGMRYPFVTLVNDVLVPVATTIPDTLTWFATATRVVLPDWSTLQAPAPTSTYQQRGGVLQKQTVRTTNDAPTMTIREWCASQDPLAVIGRYVELDASGLGCCPFSDHHVNGRDVHPSLIVCRPTPPDIRCWYCRTWNAGGSLFDFLKYYYGLDNKTLWSRILSGGQY